MWLLENDGDVFHGKKLWLRPGKRFIFGRTLADVGGFTINHKTISRKHLVLEVGSVDSGDGTQLSKRSIIVAEDMKTKIGTLVNGKQIRGLRYELEGTSFEIKLGHFEHVFRITWKPVVISFSFSAKELKNRAFEDACERLENLDIKIMSDVVRGVTTHVVSKKRNTARCLEALIVGCYIVESTFVDAITAAAQEPADGQPLLETDFGDNWPDALDFLPPRGNAPSERPNSDYIPDPKRQDVFEGYTFVFYDQAQFDSLQGPISNGGGKAMISPAEPGITTVEEFVRYVKSVAGEKGLGEFEDGSEGKGVVVVKFQPPEGPQLSWYSNFSTRVSLQLDHRLILQNEFLDAILCNNASQLRKPLEVEPSGTAPISRTQASQSSVVEQSRLPEMITTSNSTSRPDNSKPDLVPNPPVRTGRARRAVTSRFRGFDDDDSKDVAETGSTQPQPSLELQSQDSRMFVSQDDDISQFSQQGAANQLLQSQKRSVSEAIEEDADDLLDQFAPGAADLKRRRLNEDAARRRRGEPSPPPSARRAQVVSPKVVKKQKDPIDVMEVARQLREKDDERRRAEAEHLQESLGDLDISEIRNLTKIEEMDVRRRTRNTRGTGHLDDSERWEERWNGRKNFKKFHRRGEQGLNVVNKVIVSLEAVKRKDFGIGDDYWLEIESVPSQSRRQKENGRTRDSDRARDRVDSLGMSENNAVEVLSDGEDVEEPPQAAQPSLRSSSTKTQTQTQIQGESSTRSTKANGRKRGAESTDKPGPAKKSRSQEKRTVVADSDDSDDGLGFRFRKR